MTAHCTDLNGDRSLGAKWEANFQRAALRWGKAVTRHQVNRTGAAVAYSRISGRHYTLPDVTVWSAPGEHHEIKHKNPTSRGKFGLEVYRFDALVWFANETGQPVYYTIHDWEHAGGKYEEANRPRDWFMVDVRVLAAAPKATFAGSSWVNGVATTVPIHYWAKELWAPLRDVWGDMPARESVT